MPTATSLVTLSHSVGRIGKPLDIRCTEAEVAEKYKAIQGSRLRPRVHNLAAPPGESRWIIRYAQTPSRHLYLDLYMKTCRHPQNRKYITRSIALSSEYKGTVICNVHRKFREVWTCSFEICQRIDIQTRWSQYFSPLPGGGVKLFFFGSGWSTL